MKNRIAPPNEPLKEPLEEPKVEAISLTEGQLRDDLEAIRKLRLWFEPHLRLMIQILHYP